ncbi:hypothetical protein SAMN05216386_1582 [Nitrosospira briensis]|uniref:Fimbrial assembly protein (PilN) n=1 Tax=Nitrosospira briensis TaxID=35799 RepID=A0A1I5AY54_9PROT|nr:fimbrial assembly protein [Nitrosospira briensis]SFN67357.1 hypothetical protein SAMN05216386_1582 [Nitrosospira briensis]
MRRLKLKFPSDGGMARRAGHGLMLLGVTFFAGVSYQFTATMGEVAYWDLRIASMDRRVQREMKPQILTGHRGREIRQEVKKANAVMSEIDLPWEALFDSVEYAAGHDVALLSLQPDAVARTMRIGGVARNIPAMLDFVGALEREPALQDAYLLKYEVKRDDPQRPVMFSLTASWA